MNDKFFLFFFFFMTFILAFYFIYIDPIYILDLKDFLEETPVYFLPTLLISILGLYVTSSNYLRKSGIDISAAFSTTSDLFSQERYISSILLVNKKDKPVIINKVFIRLGNNIYIHMYGDYYEAFVLKPYESFNQKLEPHMAYMVGSNLVGDLTDVLYNKKIKKKIVLDTTDGMYVCSDLKRKDTFYKILSHYYTSLIVRHKGKFINDIPVGNNTLYFIELLTKDSENSFIKISNKPEESLLDGKLKFNIELLKTVEGKNHIEEVINKAITDGDLDWKSFKVHSQLNIIKHYEKFKDNEIINLNDMKYYNGWFMHNIILRIVSNYKRFKNRKPLKKNKLTK
ncbi:hypothetical protein ACG907_18550 [Acinetobacter bereziniae]|uniref:hypothetical protein n=1 Tax=Acinetobacter bereziniae TaxID=106648 RepID=UPI003AF7CAE3